RRSIARRDRRRLRLGALFLGAGGRGRSRPKDKNGTGEDQESGQRRAHARVDKHFLPAPATGTVGKFFANCKTILMSLKTAAGRAMCHRDRLPGRETTSPPLSCVR